MLTEIIPTSKNIKSTSPYMDLLLVSKWKQIGSEVPLDQLLQDDNIPLICSLDGEKRSFEIFIMAVHRRLPAFY